MRRGLPPCGAARVMTVVGIVASAIAAAFLVFGAGIAFAYATSREPSTTPRVDMSDLTDQDRAWIRHHQELTRRTS